MTTFLRRFHHDESGAVTVDWVVITGMIVLFAATLGYGLRDTTIAAGEELGEEVSQMEF